MKCSVDTIGFSMWFTYVLPSYALFTLWDSQCGLPTSYPGMPSSHYRILNVVYLRLTQVCPVHTIRFSMWFTYVLPRYAPFTLWDSQCGLPTSYPGMPRLHYGILNVVYLRLLQVCPVHTMGFSMWFTYVLPRYARFTLQDSQCGLPTSYPGMPRSHNEILTVVYLRLTKVCPVHTMGFSMWFTYVLPWYAPFTQ